MKVLILLLALIAKVAISQTQQTGMYARLATPIWDSLWSDSGKGRSVSIPSPAGSARLVARWIEVGRDSGVQLTLEERGTTLWTRKVIPGVGIEAAWAPDSKAFFVTSSGGGRNGFYGLTVYFLSQGAVREVKLTPLIEAAFGHPVKCQTEEPPNVAGVKWTANSQELVAVAEIAGHSNCDSEGTFRAYQVSFPEGSIMRSYDQIEAKRLFGSDLGWEIKSAPDRCIGRPSSCWQSFNHDSRR
jgi:hypothetical protein